MSCDRHRHHPHYNDITDPRMKITGRITDLFGNVGTPYTTVHYRGKMHSTAP
jgi:rRNA processing protein Gar1